MVWSALVVCAAAACSVKEPREGGPCWIMIDSGDIYPVSLALWDGSRTVASDYADSNRVFEFSNNGGMLIMTAVSGEGASIPEDGILLLSDGTEADSVYACRSVLDCSREWVRDTVRCRKQFATIRLILDISSSHPKYPESMRVVSRWNGLDLRTMDAVEGEYTYVFHNRENVPPIRIWRQGDYSLMLELMGSDGTLLDEVPLGLLLIKAGYDWDEDPLRDTEVILSEAGMELTFSVRDWETGESREIVI